MEYEYTIKGRVEVPDDVSVDEETLADAISDNVDAQDFDVDRDDVDEDDEDAAESVQVTLRVFAVDVKPAVD